MREKIEKSIVVEGKLNMSKSKIEKEYNFEYGKEMNRDAFIKLKKAMPKIGLEEFTKIWCNIPNFSELTKVFIEVYKETIEKSEKMSKVDKKNLERLLYIALGIVIAGGGIYLVSQLVKIKNTPQQMLENPFDDLIEIDLDE